MQAGILLGRNMHALKKCGNVMMVGHLNVRVSFQAPRSMSGYSQRSSSEALCPGPP